jgi:type IX secretion system PorP/SprF family membrane protein
LNGKLFVLTLTIMTKRFLLLGFMLLLSRLGQAQDPQFTQFYAAPLYLNPAFAGSALAPRITVNYRNQWPSVANYVTSMVGIDHYIPRFNSGVGLMLISDNQGQGQIRSTEIAGQYAYQVQLSDVSAVRLGLQASYVNRSVGYFGLTFGDQFNNQGFIQGQQSADAPLLAAAAKSNKYLDFSTGALYYSDWFWVGASAHHINRPNQGFFVGANSRLPIKGSLHMGLRIPLMGFTGLGDEDEREISFSPVVHYKFQGKYDQLDLGAYLTYSPLTVGAYYRGLPFKKYDQRINNHDAMAFLVGFRQDKFSIGYSYDATISTLGFASGGSHEISLSYIFDPLEPGRKTRVRRKNPQLACPKF